MKNTLTLRSPLAALSVAAMTLLAAAPGVTAMADAPSLGAAASFAVLGASTVTNTGSTIVTGDLGVSPGTAITGFPPGTVTGTTHSADAAALAAQNSVTTAYNALAGQACDVNLTGIDLGGHTLTPGAYCFSSSAQLTGTLTLDAQGNPGAVWVFQIGSTLTTASGSRVVFINGGQACGAFWQVGSSATLGTTTAFSGNILALASITVTTGVSSSGALFARTGAVTLDTNNVSTAGSCAVTGAAGALQATVPDLFGVERTTSLGATGSLVDDGDARNAALPTGSIPSVGGANVLHATTISSITDRTAGDGVSSEASLADLSVTVAGITISAEFVMAEAAVPVGGPSAGKTSMEGLAANGVPIEPTGAENQTISLPGLTLVVNEVQRSGSAITVNALHITSLDGLVDLVVASAKAGLVQ